MILPFTKSTETGLGWARPSLGWPGRSMTAGGSNKVDDREMRECRKTECRECLP